MRADVVLGDDIVERRAALVPHRPHPSSDTVARVCLQVMTSVMTVIRSPSHRALTRRRIKGSDCSSVVHVTTCEATVIAHTGVCTCCRSESLMSGAVGSSTSGKVSKN